jgi:hypothetical protein
MTSAWSSGATPRSFTLALRIQFSGRDALKISSTSRDRLQFLFPWLREILTSLRLPSPKNANFVKPYDARGIIDMFWDLEADKVSSRVLYPSFSTDSGRTDQPLVDTLINRCSALEASTLTEKSM